MAEHADAQAMIEDREYGPNRAAVLRAVRALTRQHSGDPEWQGVSAKELTSRLPFCLATLNSYLHWLEVKGLLVSSTHMDGPWRPTRIYRTH